MVRREATITDGSGKMEHYDEGWHSLYINYRQMIKSSDDTKFSVSQCLTNCNTSISLEGQHSEEIVNDTKELGQSLYA